MEPMCGMDSNTISHVGSTQKWRVPRLLIAITTPPTAAAAPQAAFEGAKKSVLNHPRPARRALAAFPCQPSHSRRLLKFCWQGQIRVVVRASASDRPMWLFQYLKVVRARARFVHIRSNALLWPHDMAACARC